MSMQSLMTATRLFQCEITETEFYECARDRETPGVIVKSFEIAMKPIGDARIRRLNLRIEVDQLAVRACPGLTRDGCTTESEFELAVPDVPASYWAGGGTTKYFRTCVIVPGNVGDFNVTLDLHAQVDDADAYGDGNGGNDQTRLRETWLVPVVRRAPS